jgi:hypothetical protein
MLHERAREQRARARQREEGASEGRLVEENGDGSGNDEGERDPNLEPK